MTTRRKARYAYNLFEPDLGHTHRIYCRQGEVLHRTNEYHGVELWDDDNHVLETTSGQPISSRTVDHTIPFPKSLQTQFASRLDPQALDSRFSERGLDFWSQNDTRLPSLQGRLHCD